MYCQKGTDHQAETHVACNYYIEVYNNSYCAYIFCKIRIYISRLICLEPHSIVILCDLDPTTSGNLYGQSHTCYVILRKLGKL